MSASQPVGFVPTPAQRRLLDFVDANPNLKTIQELCAGAGVPSSTYYHWCKSNDFRLWFAASWSARLTMDGVVLLNQARLLATRSFSYWKALFNLTFDPKGFAMLQQWQQTAAQLPSDAFTSADPDPAPAPTPESSAAAVKRELCRQAAWQPRPAGKTASGPSATDPRLQSPAQSNQSVTTIHWRKPSPASGLQPEQSLATDFREAATSTRRQTAAGDAENEAPRCLSPRPPTPKQHVRTLRSALR